MNMKRLRVVFPLLLILSCDGDGTPQGETWLGGDTETRFASVAKQMRGFDVTMVEVGYRYGELYWAGADQNWNYAAYQVEKIRSAIALGLERRPKRAASAAVLESALIPLEAAIKARDAVQFAKRFDQLTVTCNACHRAERVAFMHVVAPTERRSSIRSMQVQEAR